MTMMMQEEQDAHPEQHMDEHMCKMRKRRKTTESKKDSIYVDLMEEESPIYKRRSNKRVRKMNESDEY